MQPELATWSGGLGGTNGSTAQAKVGEDNCLYRLSLSSSEPCLIKDVLHKKRIQSEFDTLIEKVGLSNSALVLIVYNTYFPDPIGI